ncbi:hypothetical protein [Halalkalibacterium halodurans]|uniref:hypothetical protein n=1 Tax=Halalkalibacterium halodurans TaxID=86665 RepID=UPI002E241015|nr:hypothetical protein [Halalkalibacterium halodurans]
MGKQRLKELQNSVVKYTDGTTDNFGDFIAEICSGTDEILDPHWKEVLELALEATDEDDAEVESVVAPIIAEVVKYAFFNDRKNYKKILQLLIAGLGILQKTPKELEYVINENTADTLGLVEQMMLNLNDGWSIRELVLNEPRDMKVVLTKEDDNS